MDVIADWIVQLSSWSRSHLSQVSLALMACILVLGGPNLLSWLRSFFAHWHFIFRTLLFIVICVGFGLATIYATPWIGKGLSYLNNYTLSPVLLVMFILIGVFADRR